MPDLTVVCDFGSSLARGIYSLDLGQTKPELVYLGPEVLAVPESAIEKYAKNAIATAIPERSAWVNSKGTYYILGHLARSSFGAIHCLEALKIDSAVQTTLGIVGTIAEKKKLPDTFEVALGVLFPWAEYIDRERYRQIIEEALASFSFRGRELHVTLTALKSLPEGAGLFARGRVPTAPGEKLRSPKDVNVAVVIIGYRNASILYIDRGELRWGETRDYGCRLFIENIQAQTSGQTTHDLLRVVCSTPKVSQKALSSLVRTRVPELREGELRTIAAAVETARTEYVTTLTNWLHQKLPYALDEILVSGGTARFLRPDLARFFNQLPSRPFLNWCDHMEQRIIRAFGDVVERESLGSRLADPYGGFYWMIERPLPRREEVKEEPRERQAS